MAGIYCFPEGSYQSYVYMYLFIQGGYFSAIKYGTAIKNPFISDYDLFVFCKKTKRSEIWKLNGRKEKAAG